MQGVSTSLQGVKKTETWVSGSTSFIKRKIGGPFHSKARSVFGSIQGPEEFVFSADDWLDVRASGQPGLNLLILCKESKGAFNRAVQPGVLCNNLAHDLLLVLLSILHTIQLCMGYVGRLLFL